MAQWKGQRIWGPPERFGFESGQTALTMFQLFNLYEFVSSVDKCEYKFCAGLSPRNKFYKEHVVGTQYIGVV